MVSNVSIQGYEGSFHQVAAQQFFGSSIEVLPCATFKEVVTAVTDGKTGAGMMAIENSIAGSIMPNYNLLQGSGLTIAGEVYLQIGQHLLANPGVTLEDIREVHSHPMALQQCLPFLEQYGWKLVETADTALSAKHVHQYKSRHIAAIAGKLAAKLFHLELLAPNIHSEENNYTRFLAIRKEKQVVEKADKASLSFHTDHSRGSLAKVLGIIADKGINLSKLQSFPIPGTDFKYRFHIDMEFGEPHQFEEAVKAMGPFTEAITVFGVYRNGKQKEKKS